jgi:hypothetical protein
MVKLQMPSFMGSLNWETSCFPCAGGAFGHLRESLFLGGMQSPPLRGLSTSQDFVCADIAVQGSSASCHQISANLAINNDLSIGAYYQLEWRPLRLPGVGISFSFADAFGAGGIWLFLVPFICLGIRISKGATRPDGGQVKFKLGDVEYGLYAAKYDDKSPILAVSWPPVGGANGQGTYSMMYARDVKVFGASASTVVVVPNVAGEISTRRNTPCRRLGCGHLLPGMDNDTNTPYALGKSLHVNLSSITIFPATRLGGGQSRG